MLPDDFCTCLATHASKWAHPKLLQNAIYPVFFSEHLDLIVSDNDKCTKNDSIKLIN